MAQFPGVRSDEVSFLERQKWMLAKRARCLKRLGSIENSKAVVKLLREVVNRREQLWTKADKNKESRRNMTGLLERKLGDNPTQDGGSRDVNIGDHAFVLQRFLTGNKPAHGEDLRIAEPLASGHNADCTSTSRDPVDSTPLNDHIDLWSNGLLGSQTPIPHQQQNEAAIQMASSRLASLQLDEKTQTVNSIAGEGTAHFDNQSSPNQSDSMETQVTHYLDDYDYENKDNDADNLYFILKPWMVQIHKLLRQLTASGGSEIYTYPEFEMPPGHVGGYFLLEGKRLIAEQYLRLLGVKPKAP